MEASTDIPEDPRISDGELQPSNNSDNHLQSAQEQLAELQLLARADLHSPASSFTSPSNKVTESSLAFEEEDNSQLNEGEPCDRPLVATGGLSSFSAILATSRKIAMASADHSAAPSSDFASENGMAVVPLDQACEPITLRRPKTTGQGLPTLNEEAEGEEDDANDENPETIPSAISTSFVDKLSSAEVVAVRQEQEQEERDTYDIEFIEMLEHLSRGKLDFLALTLGDLTIQKLKRVHAALGKAQPSTPTMPYVRTLVSVDMLQLLLRRLGAQTVRDAISRAMQHASEREGSISGLDQIVLLTSSNISAVVLEARQELTTAKTSVVSPQFARRTSPVTGKEQVHQSSRISSRSCSSPSSSVSSSPRCGTPRSPAADRRSILAKEGVHVLMQEKIVSFDHRGKANDLPAFRVRGASAALTDSAAKRRQRGLQYANEHISHRTVHM
ncbi:hypothetical protein PI124_g4794 [Phytophthora idaei]|nr:hypothetical protein PI125_g2304 [Phytophthora idaei]KAG3165727.1 hypothetical protein PI126_g4488 [Phytophthora idaei]KAG3250577.1 hypothetical protein PI124_g4794 [Phytophthora idaei]